MAISRKSWGWGLIGPGRFAHEFADELRGIKRARCAAVASTSQDRATQFAAKFGFEHAFGDYDSLIHHDDVDIVYVALPHVFHSPVAEKAIRAGKAVVCEKPLTPNIHSTRKLISLAKDRGVFLMEAMKTGFLPAFQRAKMWIDEGRIGEVKLVRSDFCFLGSDNPDDRLMNPELGGGCVLDVGIYPLYICWRLLGKVTSMKATGSLTHTGVEDTVAISTRHENGACAAITASFRSSDSMGTVILGTEGKIEIPVTHAAQSALLTRDDGNGDSFNDDSGAMVGPEIEAAMDALDAGLTECPGHTLDDTLHLSELMDEVLSQIHG